MKNLNAKITGLSFYLLIISILILGFTFVNAQKNNQAQIGAKEAKISVLINEVGDLRQQNDSYLGLFNKFAEEIYESNGKILEIKKNINEINSTKSEEITQLQTEMRRSNEDLIAEINHKEELINELAIKNDNLQDKIKYITNDPDIINFLFLGINAGLTDTIIISSINEKKQSINFLSLPRDLSYNGRKINELYTKFGIEKVNEAVFQITGLKINYYFAADMNVFTDFIDEIGGINVYVDKAIVDNSYPGPNNSYITVNIPKGKQSMNGTQALKYARSRKTTSDFDRSKRQQKILTAIKDKIIDMNLIYQIDTARKIYAIFSEKVDKNSNLFEMLGFASDYKDYHINTGNTIDTTNYLYSTRNYKGQYILLPKQGSFSKVNEFVYKLVNN
ncbi:hypothetical protein GF340_03880 [Candidatus Peregrinibacteria bacterium]|nr:hypothetical protein [Candidatus Peregrinibacteria bacterium]